MKQNSILTKIKKKYKHNINIGVMNWFRINTTRRNIFLPNNIIDLQNFIRERNSIKIDFIGRGSNLLIKNSILNSIIIKLDFTFSKLLMNNNIINTVSTCYSQNLSKFSVKKYKTGLEFYSEIPGTVGGALSMNSGTNKFETRNVLISTIAINIERGEINNYNDSKLRFSYRKNSIEKKILFLLAKFKARKNKIKKLDTIPNIMKKKYMRQPLKYKNSGSTFKNTKKIKIWKLIDCCNLRGFSYKKAKISLKHCNFIISTKEIKASHIIHLANIIKNKIRMKFNLKIQLEIKVIK